MEAADDRSKGANQRVVFWPCGSRHRRVRALEQDSAVGAISLSEHAMQCKSFSPGVLGLETSHKNSWSRRRSSSVGLLYLRINVVSARQSFRHTLAMATITNYDEEKKVAVISDVPVDADVPAYDGASSIDTITALVAEGEQNENTAFTVNMPNTL